MTSATAVLERPTRPTPAGRPARAVPSERPRRPQMARPQTSRPHRPSRAKVLETESMAPKAVVTKVSVRPKLEDTARKAKPQTAKAPRETKLAKVMALVPQTRGRFAPSLAGIQAFEEEGAYLVQDFADADHGEAEAHTFKESANPARLVSSVVEMLDRPVFGVMAAVMITGVFASVVSAIV